MKYQLIIDKTKEESIVITVHEKTDKIKQIEDIINSNKYQLLAYNQEEIVPININEVFAFFTNDSKVYVSLNDNELLIKERIYQVEELLDNSFIKINQD